MKTVSASIKSKLLNHARANGVELGPLMEQYALDRLFWRLSQSRYADRFVLKGAQLFQIWSGAAHRPTRDADFLRRARRGRYAGTQRNTRATIPGVPKHLDTPSLGGARVPKNLHTLQHGVTR